eukprot:UN01019
MNQMPNLAQIFRMPRSVVPVIFCDRRNCSAGIANFSSARLRVMEKVLLRIQIEKQPFSQVFFQND